MADEVLLSIPEAARRLSVGMTVMYELVRTKKVASIKLGRRRLIHVKSLDAFVEEIKGNP